MYIIILKLLIYIIFSFQIINIDNNFNQEKVKSLSLSMNNKNHYNKDCHLTNEDQLQKLNDLNFMEHSNLKNIDSENINIFDDLSQLQENISDNQNKKLSGLCIRYNFFLLLVCFFMLYMFYEIIFNQYFITVN